MHPKFAITAAGRSTIGWRDTLLPLATAAMLAFAQHAAAAELQSVDFTVHETIPLTVGKIVRGHLPGCPHPTVRTIRAGSSQSGTDTTFNGSKKFYCGPGDSLTISFRVKTSSCQSNDAGEWKVTRGTGAFAAAQGQGRLVGTYTLASGPGTFCSNDGVDDRYTGTLQ